MNSKVILSVFLLIAAFLMLNINCAPQLSDSELESKFKL